MAPKRLVVAIDFGTTYSGIAYCFPEVLPDGILTGIREWPGTAQKVFKVPTVIRYNKDDADHFEWGALVKSSPENIMGIKLLLDPDQTLPWQDPQADIETTLSLLPPSKSPKDVTADFLRALKAYGLSQIKVQTALTNLGEYDVEYVMSVPAVWSDAAKNATLEAAKLAGIFPVTLIKEPEAAALYTIHRLGKLLKPHDVILICDAGGGTVDLISYEIETIDPKLQLKELTPGTGAMVGSVTLDRRFKSAVKRLLPDDKWEKLKNSWYMDKVSQIFETTIKPEFTGHLGAQYGVPVLAGLGYDPDKGIEPCEWKMTGAEVKDIFDPVVTDIIRLIRQQLQSVQSKGKAVRAIFLVGGFGSSRYLLSEVEKIDKDIVVAQPDDAWAAIAKGAALSKMPSQAVVTGVSAVRHYGVEALAVFDSTIDKGQYNFFDTLEGLQKVCRMSWFVNIGDSIQRNQKIRLPFNRVLPEHFQPLSTIFHETLYDCNENVAPTHRSKSQAIKENCVIYYDIRNFPFYKFQKMPKWPGNSDFFTQGLCDYGTDLIAGESYWHISFDLVISFDSAVMTFSLEVDGETFGSVQAKFEP